LASTGVFPASGDSPVPFTTAPDVASTTTPVKAGGLLGIPNFVKAVSLRQAELSFTASATAGSKTTVPHGLVGEAGEAVAPKLVVPVSSTGTLIMGGFDTTNIYVTSSVASDAVTVLLLY
jgi:hypothetical protein